MQPGGNCSSDSGSGQGIIMQMRGGVDRGSSKCVIISCKQNVQFQLKLAACVFCRSCLWSKQQPCCNCSLRLPAFYGGRPSDPGLPYGAASRARRVLRISAPLLLRMPLPFLHLLHGPVYWARQNCQPAKIPAERILIGRQTRSQEEKRNVFACEARRIRNRSFFCIRFHIPHA